MTGVTAPGGLLGSNGVCVADQSTEELLQTFRNGSTVGHAPSLNGNGNGYPGGNGNGNGHGNGNGYGLISQAAFEEIVRRYAGMVYSVCLQVTRDVHDAEDATQAAFLTLAVRARTAESIKYLGPWLQKVARRLSLDIMRAKKRRKRREERRGEMTRQLQPDRDPRMGLDRAELSDIVRDELGKLPTKYRLPLILHYFGGLRPEEVARELGYKPSTLGVRLHRGRKMLADNLAERGITLTNGMLASILAGIVHIGISDNVIAQASLAAAGLVTNGELPGAIFSARIIALTRQAANAVIWAKMKSALAMLALAGAVLIGGVQTVRAYAPELLNPRNWDLGRIVRPLLRSIFREPQMRFDLPRISQVAPQPAADDQTALASLTTLPQWLHSDLATTTGEPIAASSFSLADAMPMSHSQIALVELPGRSVATLRGDASGSASLSIAHGGAMAPAHGPIGAAYISDRILASISPASPAPGFRVDPSTRTAFHSSGTRRHDHLVLDSRASGGGGAAFDRYVTSASANLVANQLTIGDAGRGEFVHGGGNLTVANNLDIGRHHGSTGALHIGGTAHVSSAQQNIGIRGNGSVTQTGGTNETLAMNLGAQRGGAGAYEITDGSLDAGQINVGLEGQGQFEQSGGNVTVASNDSAPGAVTVGAKPGSDGKLTVRGGRLTADKLDVGDRGRGDLQQRGGVTSVRDMSVGAQAGGQGRVTIHDGQLQVRNGGSIVVGDKGDGSVILNSSSGTPPIVEVPRDSGASLSIRATENGRGQLTGFGDVRITGQIVQNGRVIAHNGELDLSTASNVTNTIENPFNGGAQGWYAERGGSIVLPPMLVPSDRTAVWGEDPNDPVPDLVNSVRVTMHGVTQPGEAMISLLAEDHGEVPTIPADEQFIGVWDFDRRSLQFASGELMIRYDDALLRAIGGDELALQIWIYDGAWTMVPGPLTITDPVQNFIGGQIDGDTQFFAVSMTDLYIPGGISIPEPSGALLGATIAGATLLRRRRR